MDRARASAPPSTHAPRRPPIPLLAAQTAHRHRPDGLAPLPAAPVYGSFARFQRRHPPDAAAAPGGAPSAGSAAAAHRAPYPRLQPHPGAASAGAGAAGAAAGGQPRHPSCPLQRLGAGLSARAAASAGLRSCLRIAPAGSGESEKAAHLLASFKRKDEETVRKEKRKMRNRLAAAKSNERRREKLEAQKKELQDLKERLLALKSKRSVVERENERLRTTLKEKRKKGDGASS